MLTICLTNEKVLENKGNWKIRTWDFCKSRTVEKGERLESFQLHAIPPHQGLSHLQIKLLLYLILYYTVVTSDSLPSRGVGSLVDDNP